ncbi:protein-L-isoaspartate(D-aspartate) O-methyltransferase [Methylosarcina fibrata]|uniref:protein-L-isoaspartate(D-aspartate) O-methyltransferase n=1 Tax=Methylosarcina fibrata TaxID=105972 RepID=UPI00036C90D7|nr:protein-L-isoaspartate(D-aspartate) O-methyltransferase [Methylosarcina fibrata]
MNDIQSMLDDIQQETAYTSLFTGREKLSGRVMDAMGRVPRDQFVPLSQVNRAFNNGPLPIGSGQTISQPYIVALMTDLLEIGKHASVLEIGTGSGYQTAILSLLAEKVYSVEIIQSLSEEAQARFKEMHYGNIKTRVGNGYEGWPEFAPYDGIIVTAAAPYVPDALVEQLKPGGRLVIPVGLPHAHQELMLLEKRPEGKNRPVKILEVAFVPLIDHPKPL